jgi:hypothetical protein
MVRSLRILGVFGLHCRCRSSAIVYVVESSVLQFAGSLEFEFATDSRRFSRPVKLLRRDDTRQNFYCTSGVLVRASRRKAPRRSGLPTARRVCAYTVAFSYPIAILESSYNITTIFIKIDLGSCPLSCAPSYYS